MAAVLLALPVVAGLLAARVRLVRLGGGGRSRATALVVVVVVLLVLVVVGLVPVGADGRPEVVLDHAERRDGQGPVVVDDDALATSPGAALAAPPARRLPLHRPRGVRGARASCPGGRCASRSSLRRLKGTGPRRA